MSSFEGWGADALRHMKKNKLTDESGRSGPPVWPEGLVAPGYSSIRHSQFKDRDYYNELITDWWSKDAKSAWAWHDSYVRAATLKQGLDQRTANVNDTAALPVAEQPPDYTPETMPFTTVEELETYMLELTAWSVRALKKDFAVQGVASIVYMGQVLRFMGLENFRLQAIEFKNQVDDTGKITNREVRFYLLAKEAAIIKKLYGLTEAEVQKMFGSAVGNFVATLAEEVSKEQGVQALRQELEKRLSRQRYEGTELEFGGW